MERITNAARKAGVTILGITLLIGGAVLLVLPGPGVLVIILGLVVLSWEYEWPKRHLHRARNAQKKAIEKVKQKKNT